MRVAQSCHLRPEGVRGRSNAGVWDWPEDEDCDPHLLSSPLLSSPLPSTPHPSPSPFSAPLLLSPLSSSEEPLRNLGAFVEASGSVWGPSGRNTNAEQGRGIPMQRKNRTEYYLYRNAYTGLLKAILSITEQYEYRGIPIRGTHM